MSIAVNIVVSRSLPSLLPSLCFMIIFVIPAFLPLAKSFMHLCYLFLSYCILAIINVLDWFLPAYKFFPYVQSIWKRRIIFRHIAILDTISTMIIQLHVNGWSWSKIFANRSAKHQKSFHWRSSNKNVCKTKTKKSVLTPIPSVSRLSNLFEVCAGENLSERHLV